MSAAMFTATAEEDTAQWSNAAENLFIDLISREAKEMTSSTLSKKQWANVQLEIVSEFGGSYKIDKLKAKWNRLRRLTREFQHLIDTPGFGFDASKNTITASDEAWDSYLKKYPDAKRFKKKGMPRYEALAQTFGKSIAPGTLRLGSFRSATTFRTPQRAPEYVDNETGDSSEEITPITPSLSQPADIKPLDRAFGKKRKTSEVQSCLDLYAKSISLASEAQRVWTEALCQYLEAQGKAKEAPEGAESSDHDEVNLCIQKLDGLDIQGSELYCKAVKEIAASKTWRLCFLALKEDRARELVHSL